MSGTDDLTAEEQALTSPGAPDTTLPPPEPAPETPQAEKPEPPKAPETPVPEAKTAPDAPKGEPNAAFAAMRREIAELKRQLAGGNAAPQPKPEPPKIPALDQDPVANLDTRTGSVEQTVKQMLEAQQAQTFQSQVLGAYQADAAKVAKENPAFTDAYQHWRDRTGAYLRTFNPGLDGAQLEQALNAHEFQFALNALRAERSPGELILAAAKELGFAPKSKEPTPTPPVAPTETLTQQVARGQQLAANPLANGGATPTPELTAATLAAMSDEDFAKVSDRDFRRVFGG